MTAHRPRANTRRSLRRELERLDDRCLPAIVRPLLFVPGQPASVPVSIVEAPTPELQSVAFDEFVGQLGAKPWELTSLFDFNLFGLVHATSPTNALVADLVNLGGYTLFEDDATTAPNLFVATQDWRMSVAPLDGVDDGILSNLTAQSIADAVQGTDLNGDAGIYRYGVDYLGYWMMKAMDEWVAAGGDPSVGVDVISHSEGHVITRSYVSSAAYGGSYTGADPGTLPRIANWVSLSGPNEGASAIYNLLQNNFSNPLGSDPAGGLYLFEEAAYLRVTDPVDPQPIFGPDGGPLITPADVASGAVTTSEFIQMYVGSLRDEMATYAFLDGQDVNDQPDFRNSMMLDVNGGTDPNAFADRVTESFTAIYGTQLPTLTTATTRTGTGGTVLPVGNAFDELADVLEMLASGQLPPTQPGDEWILDNEEPTSGDGTVAVRSTLSTYLNDPRITVLPQDRLEVDHNFTVSDPYIHLLLLKILQPNLPLFGAQTGARVTNAAFSGATPGTFDRVRLTFSKALTASTLTEADVTLTDPAGNPLEVSGVAAVANTGGLQFDVTFARQTVLGGYAITTGVDIRTTTDLPMNQNGNALNGSRASPPPGQVHHDRDAGGLVDTPIVAVGQGDGSVRILNGTTGDVLIPSFRPLDAGGKTYGTLPSVALGDFNSDGVADLLVAATRKGGTHGLDASKAGRVFVYDGAALRAGDAATPFRTFTPFSKNADGTSYDTGLEIAVGDVNGDETPDLIAGSRGDTCRFTAISGVDTDGALPDVRLGAVTVAFGAAYARRVNVAAGDSDGDGRAEIAVVRGGTNETPTAGGTAVPVKVFALNESGFTQSNLTGQPAPGGVPVALKPFAGNQGAGGQVIDRAAFVAAFDADGDARDDLVVSALDRVTDPSNPRVRVSVYSIDPLTGKATRISENANGNPGTYLVGGQVTSHSIAAGGANDDGVVSLVVALNGLDAGVLYLAPLNGSREAKLNISFAAGGISRRHLAAVSDRDR